MIDGLNGIIYSSKYGTCKVPAVYIVIHVHIHNVQVKNQVIK